MKNFNGKDSPADTAWKMFEKTGNIGYYMLFKRLTEK